jgi:acyl-CoA synthetase (NDP forming)
MLAPRSLAIVGATDKGPVTAAIVNTLDDYGYAGGIHLVNRRGGTAAGRDCVPSVSDVPGPLDLALVIVPAPAVPEVIEECSAIGVGCAVVFTSGFAELGEVGRALQQRVRSIARHGGLRLMGPNTEGFVNLDAGFAATFSSNASYAQVATHLRPAPVAPEDVDERRSVLELARGEVAVVGQSGGIAFSLFNRGLQRGLRFSHLISTGNEADVDMLDVFEFLIDDPSTRIIMAYLEGFADPARFPAVARRAQQAGKHLVIAKVGRSEVAARAVMSHTGHLAGSDAAYRAVFERYGVIALDDPEDMLDAALAISTAPAAAGPRVGIVTLSGGSGVWLADACAAADLDIPVLPDEVRTRAVELLPPYVTPSNPMDVSGTSIVPPARLLSVMAESADLDAFVLVTTLARVERLEIDAPDLRAIVDRGKPVLIFSYTEPSEASLKLLETLRLPVFLGPRRCAVALSALVRAGRTPEAIPAIEPDELVALRRAVAAVADRGPTIPEFQAKRLIARVGVPIPAERMTTTVDEAAAAATEIGYPVVLKVQSPDVPHKAAAGGVALGIRDERELTAAFERVAAVARAGPGVAFDGVLVATQVGAGVEIIVGVQNGAGFGPMVLVGLGGTLVEIIDRSVLHPAPFGRQTAQGMLEQLGLRRLIKHHRDGFDPLVDLTEVLARISILAIAMDGQLAELDVNPIMWDPVTGAVNVLDALAVAAQPEASDAHPTAF